MSLQKSAGKRWNALIAEGKNVLLLGQGSRWIVFTCQTEMEAEHKVKELKLWSKSVYDNEQFNRLCRAGD